MAEIKVTYVDHMGDDLRIINSARISFGNQKSELDDKDKKLIGYLAKNEHLSPFEHNMLTVIIDCPLYIRSQIHRHRTFSYNEVSRRYTSENLEFYVPPVDDIRTQHTSNKQASGAAIEEHKARELQSSIKHAHAYALDFFNTLVNAGVAREQARGVLPQNLMTSFYMTGNLRNWVHFVRLREDAHAQKEVQLIAKQVKSLLQQNFPVACDALFKIEEDRKVAQALLQKVNQSENKS